MMTSEVNTEESIGKELQRMLRVSDQMVTGYSRLSDWNSFLSICVDVIIMFLSAWLSALAFASEDIVTVINPSTFSNQMFIGIVSVTTFITSLIQLKVDWKGKAAAYESSKRLYSGFKLELRELLSDKSVVLDAETLKQVTAKYTTAGHFSIPIPDNKFVSIKKAHLLKVEMSKYLDNAPGSSLIILRVKIWWRDNFSCKK